jgi:hypothetical protein
MSNPQHEPHATHTRATHTAEWRTRFGWVMRLFTGPSRADVCADLNQVEAHLNHAKWQRQLLVTGQPAHAIIRARRETGDVVNRTPVVAFDLDVHADGHPAWRVTVTTPVPKLAMPDVNDVIEVRYNPENRQEVALLQ